MLYVCDFHDFDGTFQKREVVSGECEIQKDSSMMRRSRNVLIRAFEFDHRRSIQPET
jgi:hypothetical protein